MGSTSQLRLNEMEGGEGGDKPPSYEEVCGSDSVYAISGSPQYGGHSLLSRPQYRRDRRRSNDHHDNRALLEENNTRKNNCFCLCIPFIAAALIVFILATVVVSFYPKQDDPITPPVTRAKFLMSCTTKFTQSGDFCWVDDSTLVAFLKDDTLVRFDVEHSEKICTASIIDSGLYYRDWTLACTKEGEVYTLNLEYHLPLRVYDIKSSSYGMWLPKEIKAPSSLAINDDHIIFGEKDSSIIYVYNRNLEYLYNDMIYGQGEVKIMDFSQDGTLLVQSDFSHLLVYELGSGEITDISTDSSTSCFTPDKEILSVQLVTDRIRVYSSEGDFLRRLLWMMDDLDVATNIKVLPQNVNPRLMAASFDTTVLQLFELTDD